jgi:hypothetical protein
MHRIRPNIITNASQIAHNLSVAWACAGMLALFALFGWTGIGLAADAARIACDDTPMPAQALTAPGYAAFDGSLDAQTGGALDGRDSARGYLVWDGRGPWGGNVKSFATDPTDASRVLVACGLSAARESGGIWLSTDGGARWIDTDLQGFPTNMAAASISEAGVFYAAAYDGLYRSVDSGAHWTRIAFTAQIIGVGVKPDDGNILIAGLASSQGVRRSTDRGVTWNTVGISTTFMKGYGASPAMPDRMFMAMSSSTNPCWRSEDAGASWVAVGPAGTDGWGIWVDPANGDRAFLSTGAGIYRTMDGGAHWTLVLSGTCYANVSEKDGVFYAPLVAQGVFESSDGGDTWTNVNVGLVASFFYASGATSAGVLAGHYGGIYRSTTPGAAWAVSQLGLNNAYVRTIAYYADRGELWAGTDQSGVWRSTDLGQTWDMKAAGMTEWSTYRLTPKDHEHGQGDRMFMTTSTGVYRSIDHGESWQLVGFAGQFMRGILIDPSNPDRVWTGGAINQQIWRSEDGGTIWNQVGAGITSGFYPDFNMGRNPLNGPRLFVNYEQLTNQIYYSDDLGEHFTPATGLSSTAYQPSLTIRDSNPAIAFCGTDIGVYKSTDYGATWAASGLTSVVWSLLGTRTTNVYAGRNRLGVYLSSDDGTTWTAMNTGIENQVIWDICYGSSTTDLFCSPRGKGVRRYSLESAGVEDSTPGIAPRSAPNPFHASSTISFERPLRGPISIRIVDAAGRTILSKRIDGGAGMASWTWDGRGDGGQAANGAYFYEVSDGSDRFEGRFVRVR